MESRLALEMVRITEAAAIESARLMGRGDRHEADRAATESMRATMDDVEMVGTIVIGEGERDEAPMLFIGEKVGNKQGPKVDIAVDPLEGTTLCAKDMPGSIAVMAMAEAGTLLAAPDVYMHKIAIGAGYPAGVVDLDESATVNVKALAKAKGVPVNEITACVLDRPRHAALIDDLRSAGVAIKLISDGDIAGIIHAVNTEDTGIDIYLGSGGAPEGVLAAAALRCIGGQMQGKLILDRPRHRDFMSMPYDYPRLNKWPEWFTASAGTMKGFTFLVVDINGSAGYQGGQDLVVRMHNLQGTFTTDNFVGAAS